MAESVATAAAASGRSRHVEARLSRAPLGCGSHTRGVKGGGRNGWWAHILARVWGPPDYTDCPKLSDTCRIDSGRKIGDKVKIENKEKCSVSFWGYKEAATNLHLS